MKFNLIGRPEFFQDKSNLEGTPAELYDRAMKFFETGNTGDGYTLLQASAEMGYPQAAFNLGYAIMQNKTFGTLEDAVRYFTSAAKQGHMEAMTNLAVCYQTGRGVKANPIKGHNLLKSASELGDDIAIVNLAQTYLFGVGIPKNEMKGWKILTDAVNKGNVSALDLLRRLENKGILPPETIEDGNNQECGLVFNETMRVDNAPECEIDDIRVECLYNKVRGGSSTELSELLELAGELMYRPAMNALRKLGSITEDSSDNFKRGTAEYLATAWKHYDVEPLRIVAAWTYPFFEYKEIKNGISTYQTNDEEEFIERIQKDFSWSIENHVVPRFRLRESNDEGIYCVDVLLEGKSLSTFHLVFSDGHFMGICRVYER